MRNLFYLIALLWAIPHSAYSQICGTGDELLLAACVPTAPSSYACGGTTTTGSNVSTLISGGTLLGMPLAATTPQYVILQGEIVVDIDYTFAPGSIIILAMPNSSSPLGIEGFRVRANITFELLGTQVFGKKPDCSDFYWRIRVSHNSKINIDASQLDHLRELVPNVGGTNQNVESIVINKSTFTNNWDFIPYVNSNALTTFQVLNSQFYTFTNNSPEPPSMPVTTYWIRIENFPSTMLIYSNRAENYTRGLYATNVASVQMGLDTIIEGWTPFRFENTTATITSNQFLDNYDDGVAIESNIFMTKNYFRILSTIDPNPLFTHERSNNKTLVIEENVFVANGGVGHGISVNRAAALDMKIHKNKFYMSNYNTNPVIPYYAIDIYNVYIFSTLFENDITENELNGYLNIGGINALDANCLNITFNKVNKPSFLSYNESGIFIERVDDSRITSNDLSGVFALTPPLTSNINRGISQDLSPLGLIKCNKITGFDYGYFADGSPSVPSALERNMFHANDYGVYIFSDIGPQINTHNTWNTPSITVDLTNPWSSYFQIHTTSSPYWPLGGFPAAILGGTGPRPGGCPALAEEEDPKDPERFAFLTDSELDLVDRFNEDATFYEQSGKDHGAMINLIVHLEKYPDLIEEHNLDDFYYSMSQTVLGKLIETDSWLRNGAGSNPLLGLNNVFDLHSSILTALIEENDPGLLAAMEQLDNELPDFLLNQVQSKENFLLHLAEKIAFVNSLETTSLITDYYKATLILLLKSFQNPGSLTPTEIEFLEDTHTLCYEEYGISVYLAKAILLSRQPINHGCNSNEQSKPLIPTIISPVSQQSLSITPTIGSDQITFSYPNEMEDVLEYIIVDAQGRVVKSGVCLFGQTRIDISKFVPQLYFVQIKDTKKQVISVGKFVKM